MFANYCDFAAAPACCAVLCCALLHTTTFSDTARLFSAFRLDFKTSVVIPGDAQETSSGWGIQQGLRPNGKTSPLGLRCWRCVLPEPRAFCTRFWRGPGRGRIVKGFRFVWGVTWMICSWWAVAVVLLCVKEAEEGWLVVWIS